MKLNLLFIGMELLTILAYPFVFIDGKLRQLSKLREKSLGEDSLIPDPLTGG